MTLLWLYTIKTRKSESSNLKPRSEDKEEGKEQTTLGIFPTLSYFRIWVARCPHKISSPGKKVEHILLKTFFSCLSKLVPYRKKTQAKPALFVLYIKNLSPPQKIFGQPRSLDLFLRLSHEPTHPKGNPSRPLRCLNCSFHTVRRNLLD
jgi:hypothetical protein